LKHEFTGSSKKKTTLVVLQTELEVLKLSTQSSRTETKESHPQEGEVAQVVTPIRPSGPVSHPGRGTAVQDD
jgi:hypothetical protein